MLSATTEINDLPTGTTYLKEWKSGYSEFQYARFDFEADQRQVSAHESIFLASHFYNNQIKSPRPGCFENEL
jgi:hypothetical protein